MKPNQVDPRMWSLDDLRAQGPQINSVHAAMVFFHIGEATAKRVVREEADQLPFPVFKLGRKRVTPTAALLRVLGVESDERDAA